MVSMMEWLEKQPELMTVGEVAALLKVSDRTIRRAIHDGRLRAIAIGRSWRIPREALLALYEPGVPKPER